MLLVGLLALWAVEVVAFLAVLAVALLKHRATIEGSHETETPGDATAG